jgi:twinkle protein
MGAVYSLRNAAGTTTEVDLDKYQDAPDRHRIVSAFSAVARERITARLAVESATYGDALPWAKTHQLVRFRPHEVTAWIGPNGDGKSMMLGALAFLWALRERRTLVCSLEMDIGTQIQRMARQALCRSDFDAEDAEEVLALVGLDLFFFDFVGQISTARMLTLVKYAAVKMDCRHIVIDNLTMIVPPGRNSDEEAARFVAGLVQIGRETGIHIHIVGHVRKPDDDRRLTRYDWRGTGACSDMVHNVCIVQRNQKKKRAEEEGDFGTHEKEPDHFLVIDKQRNGSFDGRLGLWWRPHCLMWGESGLDHPQPINLHPFE